MHSHELVEQIAALVLIAAGAFFLPASWLARRRALRRPAAVKRRANVGEGSAAHALNATIATLSLGAAVIHLAVMPGHLDAFPPFGIAFAAVATAQVVSGLIALAGRWRAVRVPIAVLNTTVIGVWTMSRTIGLPLGPEAWQPEPVGFADVVALAFEVGLLLALTLDAARGPVRRSAPANGASAVAIVPVVGLLAAVALLAATSVLTEGSRHHGHASAATIVAGIRI